MVSQIYPRELQLNTFNTSDTEASFLNLHLSISNDIVSTKIYYKRDDFGLNIYYSINTNDIQHTYIVKIQRIRTKANASRVLFLLRVTK